MIGSRLLKHFFAHYLQVVATLGTGVVVLAYIAVFTEFARQAGGSPAYSLGGNLLVSALKMPLLIQSITPFIVLFSAMASLTLLNRAGELVVARTAGLSAWQFLAPFCLGSFLIGLATVAILNPFTARSVAAAQQMERAIRDGRPAALPTHNIRWLTDRSPEGLMAIGASEVQNSEGQLADVTVLQFDSQRKFVARMDSKQATLDGGVLHLRDVSRLDSMGERENLPDARIETRLKPEYLTRQFSNLDSASVFELPGLIGTARELGLPTSGFATRLHALLALPFLLIAMTLIAAAVSMRFSRTGQSALSALVGLAAGFVFYVVATIATAAGDAGILAPIAAGWLPVAMGACFSVLSLLHSEDG